MIKVVTRSGNFSNLLRTVTSVGPSTNLPIAPAFPEDETPAYPSPPGKNTAYAAACSLPTKKMSVVTGPSVNFSVRFNHTDVKGPDFSNYRRDICKDPNAKSRDKITSQKLYTSVVSGVGCAAGLCGAKAVIRMFIESMAPSADVLALAKIEINKADVPEGKNVTFKWRGKPLFVRHRTDLEISTEEKVDLSSLRDPEHDNARTKDPKWLVVLGICTHLGCVPIPYQGDWKGYYCPCHGSHYDASGRIRKGPAPLNLEVPPYEFVGDLIVVG